MRRHGVAAITIMATSLVALPATGQDGAKALFYNSASGASVPAPSPGPAPQASRPAPPRDSYLGLAYWIELLGPEGQSRRVTTDRVFRAGERIRLHIQSNRDGYLYLINLGSTGRSTLLFPNPATAAGGNAVRAGLSYPVPHNAFLRFDENPGEETLVVMLSPAPMEGLALDPRMPAVSSEDTTRLLNAAKAKGAKDLVVEVDSRSSLPATYAVAPLGSLADGGLITLRVRLRHQ